MNPLVKTVQAMCEAVAKGEDTFKGPYYNPSLVELGSRLLSKNHGRIRLKQVGQQRRHTGDTSVVLYSGGVFSYMALIRELRLRRRVVVVKVTGDAADDLALGLEWDWLSSETKDAGLEADNPTRHDFRRVRDLTAEVPELVVAVTNVDVGSYSHRLQPLARLALASEFASEEGAGSIVLGDYLGHDLHLYREASTVFKDFYGRPMVVRAPYQEQRPLLAIKEHLDSGFSAATLINETFSCEENTQTLHPMCGECWGCYKRFKIFEAMGWVEKHFAVNPWKAKDFSRFEHIWTKLNA